MRESKEEWGQSVKKSGIISSLRERGRRYGVAGCV